VAFAIRDRTETTLSEINVTPMVDVMLVLLIIFMVTAPMLSATVDVELEQSGGRPSPQAEEHLVVSITAAQEIFVAETMTDLELVASRVKETMQQSGVRDVALRGDRRVPFGYVLKVFDALHQAGVRNVGLVMQPSPDLPKDDPR